MIAFEKATKFCRRSCVFRMLNFTVSKPEIIIVAGENGAGKTTFLNCAAGFAKLSSGRVKFAFGNDLSENCFFFDEKTYFPAKKIAQIIKEIASFDCRFDGSVCRDIIGKFGLSEADDYGKLSRGKKMLFGNAVALSWNKPMLLFDEPCAGLDEFSRFAFYKVLNVCFSQNPRTIFLSTNLLGEPEKLASRILLLTGGGDYVFESLDYFENLFIEVEGEAEITDVLAQNRKVYAKKGIGYLNSFVIENNLDYREKKLVKQSGVKISPVSAAAACGFIIENRRGNEKLI